MNSFGLAPGKADKSSQAAPQLQFDIDQKLSEDKSGAFRDELLNKLSRYEEALNTQLNGGMVGRVGLGGKNGFIEAIEKAKLLVQQVWATKHAPKE